MSNSEFDVVILSKITAAYMIGYAGTPSDYNSLTASESVQSLKDFKTSQVVRSIANLWWFIRATEKPLVKEIL